MSGNDDFLARWSRRKREVEAAETTQPQPPPPRGDRLAEGSSSGEFGVDAASPNLSRQGGEPAPEVPEALPRIEDLTAESDLSVFLRHGVPEALKNAALRRMWSLDPAIRDFVGPAEYAWDYNNPGAIPGFGAVKVGPLVSAAAVAPSPPRGETVAAKRLGERVSSAERSAGDPYPSPSPQVGEETPTDPASGTTIDSRSTGTGEEERAGSADEPPERTGPRHGGALPR